jgi:large subunit ribosomal protein L18
MAHVKLTPREKRKIRLRKKVRGTPERPRISVYKSNRYLYAQIIDDVSQVTLAAASSVKQDKGCGKAAAAAVGSTIAVVAKQKNIGKVVFDANGFRYHGVIKEIADAARKGGLEF